VGNYNFGYDESHTSGGSFRRETGNALGVKTGSYGLMDADGRVRVVNYVADEHGFRVSVATNEPGTDVSSPAAASITRPGAPVIVKTPVAAVAAPLAALLPKPVRVEAPVAVTAPVVLKAPVYAAPVYAARSLKAYPTAPVHYTTTYHSQVYGSPLRYPLPVFAHPAAPVAAARSFVYGHKVTH
ncbi:unnamed protein product, partial [Ixodes hexagonus]